MVGWWWWAQLSQCHPWTVVIVLQAGDWRTVLSFGKSDDDDEATLDDQRPQRTKSCGICWYQDIVITTSGQSTYVSVAISVGLARTCVCPHDGLHLQCRTGGPGLKRSVSLTRLSLAKLKFNC